MDDLYRPYIIYLTEGQQEELARYIRQTKWNIEIFKCVHEDFCFLVDMLIQDEELALDTIRKCKEHREGNGLGRKRRYSDKRAKIDNKKKTVKNVVSNRKEYQNSDNYEIRNTMVSDNGASADHDRRLNHLEEIHVEHCKHYKDKEYPELDSSNEKHVEDENSLTRTKRDSSVQDKTHVKMSYESNIELKTLHQEENNHKSLMNMQMNCDVIAVQKICPEGVHEGDILNTDIAKNDKSESYTFRHKKSTDRFKLLELVKMAELKDQYRCNLCDKLSVTENTLKSHKEKNHSDKRAKKKKGKIKLQKEPDVVACHICRKLFVDKYSLNTHHLKMHIEKQNVYQCDLCGAVLKHLGNLVQHKKSLHGGTRTHHCDICGNSFKLYQHLKTHKRRHDPSFVETCTICGKTVRKGHLSTHMKRHSNEKNFQCNTCSKAFYVKQDLERHTILHSGEKPYKCQFCSYACAFKGNLTKHVKKKH